MAPIEALNGRISQYTPASRTRRAISCVYCDPKSSIITVSCCGTLLKKTSAPGLLTWNKRVADYTQTRINRKKLAVVLTCALFVVAATFAIRASANTGVLLSEPLTVRWRYQSNVTLNLTPAFDKERVYLPLAGGAIVALTARDGQLYWRSDMGGELSASPVADESAIYVASETTTPNGDSANSSGALRALGREGGVTQWMTRLVKPLRGALSISDKKLFAGGSDGRAYA